MARARRFACPGAGAAASAVIGGAGAAGASGLTEGLLMKKPRSWGGASKEI